MTLEAISILCLGGPFDGCYWAPAEVAMGELSEEHRVVWAIYWLTKGGGVAKRFWLLSPYALQAVECRGIETAVANGIQKHIYEVAESTQLNGEHRLMIRYLALESLHH